MPRVVIEYDLPREQEDLEGAIMGRESARILAELRQFLVDQQAASESDLRKAHTDLRLGRLQGLSDALAHLDQLTRAQGDRHDPRRISADE